METLAMRIESKGAGYEITPLLEQCRIVERWWGMWNGEILSSYVRDTEAAERQMRHSSTTFTTLVDLREFKVQTQQIAIEMRALVDGLNTSTKKTAIVMDSALLKLQAMRITTAPHRQMFSSMLEAENWLDQD
jgi:citrate synthase